MSRMCCVRMRAAVGGAGGGVKVAMSNRSSALFRGSRRLSRRSFVAEQFHIKCGMLGCRRPPHMQVSKLRRLRLLDFIYQYERPVPSA
jgi:hypothetical protein